jgi:hypothetical protein
MNVAQMTKAILDLAVLGTDGEKCYHNKPVKLNGVWRCCWTWCVGYVGNYREKP